MNLPDMEMQLRLSSCPENISQLQPFISELRHQYAFCEDLYYDILLVLTEAVNNSILHGNQADPAKNVDVFVKQEQRQLRFTVKDEGRGFDPAKLADPTAPDRIDCPNGRGVFIMRELSDSLGYSNYGRQLDIRFSLR